MKTILHRERSRLCFIKPLGALLAAVALLGPGSIPRAAAQTTGFAEDGLFLAPGLPVLSKSNWEAGALAAKLSPSPVPTPDRLPMITSQPQDLAVLVGQPAAFSVVAVDATNVPPVSRAAGGPNADHFVYATGTPRGTLVVSYNFFSIPDRMQVFYEGTQIFDSGVVSGSSTTSVPFGPGAASTVEVVMNETNGLSGTVWDYTASILRPPLTYQWRRDGAAIPGATNDTHSIPAAGLSDAAYYSVVVANASGSNLSASARLAVQPGLGPIITAITPLNQTVAAGLNANITVMAIGTEPLAYRWVRNGLALAERTNSLIAFNPAQTNDSGAYFCVVTNAFGSATSAVAMLNVTNVPPPLTFPLTNRLVSFDQVWRYHDVGMDLSNAWRAPAYADLTWPTGPGLLGYETAPLPFPILTPLAQRSNVVTRYFRTQFNFTHDPAATVLSLRTVVDDGAVFYLNGVEVLRLGIAEGVTVLYSTGPSRAVGDAMIEGPFVISSSNLVAGDNVLAAELHQAGMFSTDAVFGGELEAVVTNGLPGLPADRLPQITSQPQSLNVLVGQPAAFSVVAVDATNVPPVTLIGGPGADLFVYSTGTPRGTLLISYDFLNQPDRMQVYYEGTQLFDSGLVSGSSTISVPFGPGSATTVEIAMNETNGEIGTLWTYTASILRPALTYQWRRNGADIPGATNETLSIPAVLLSDAGQYSVIVANASGSKLSATAILTVRLPGVAPTITAISPLNQTVVAGSNAAITVTATGTEPLAYRWFRNGLALPERTTPTIAFTPAQTNHSGAYFCVVTNGFGAATSAVAMLTVSAPTGVGPPVITFPTFLQVRAGPPGGNPVLSVTATGAPPLAYHWHLNGPTQPLPGPQTRFLALTNVQVGQAGTYTVVVSNALGTVTNLGIVVNVLVSGPGSSIAFSNGIPFTNGLVFDLSGTNLVPAGSSILAQLDAGFTADNLQPLGGAAGFASAGRFAGGVRRLPGSLPGQTVFGRVRCWAADFGASYEQALEAGGPIGQSSIFPITLPSVPTVAAPLLGLPSFSLVPGLPPEITVQPQSLTLTQGMDAMFSATAGGSGPRTYQWRFEGTDIPGAIGSSLSLPAAQPAQSGLYSVRVANAFGTADSVEAQLTVVPTNRPPVAFGATVSLAEDTTAAITLMASDPNGDTLSYTVIAPQFGAWSGTPPHLVYTPPPNFFGPDSFTFSVRDGALVSETATVHLIVQPVNDPPIANAGAAVVEEDSSVLLSLLASDVENDPLLFSVTLPTHGSLAGAPPNVTYTPAPNYYGPDSFTFTVHDGQTSSAPATVSLEVRPVNDPPAVSGQAVSTDEDTPITLTLAAADIDGDTLAFELVAPAQGTLSGAPPNVTYAPAANFHGFVSFSFRVNDGQTNSEAAIVSVTVRPVNDPPSATPQSITVNEDSSARISLVAADVDGDALTYSVASPAHGTLSGSAPNFVYQPAGNYHGPDSFTFSVNDGQTGSPVVEVAITVVSVNDPPVAVATVSPIAVLTPGNTNWIVLSPDGSNAPVILDATGSFDPENDPLEFLWVEGELPVILGGGPRLTNTFSAGEHAVVLIADDGTDTGVGEFTFLVLSPGEAVGEVILMLDQSGMPRQAMRPLLATLKASIASLDRGNLTAGANQLRAFLNKIRAQVAPHDPQLAADLTAAVEIILQTMER